MWEGVSSSAGSSGSSSSAMISSLAAEVDSLGWSVLVRVSLARRTGAGFGAFSVSSSDELDEDDEAEAEVEDELLKKIYFIYVIVK